MSVHHVPFGVASAREINRRNCVDPRKIAEITEPPLFPRFARWAWPEKTAATLASLIDASPRSAERWVSGEVDPPYEVVELTMQLLFSRKRRPLRK